MSTTVERAQIALRTAFAALPARQRANLRKHAEAGTRILCRHDSLEVWQPEDHIRWRGPSRAGG